MFYRYFRPFTIISNIFGLPKPIVTSKRKSIKINIWLKIWSLLFAAGLISSYAFLRDRLLRFDVKKDLGIIPDVTDLFVNIIIIIINLFNSEIIYISIHEVFDDIFKHLNITDYVLKLFAYKMYLWYFTAMIMFIILIVMEILNDFPPFILLIRIPTFLSILHLIMHLYLLSALLKVINHQLSRTLIEDNVSKIISIDKIEAKYIFKYMFSPSIEFIEINDIAQLDLKCLCKLYDRLSICLHLLEKCYGLQVRFYTVPFTDKSNSNIIINT